MRINSGRGGRWFRVDAMFTPREVAEQLKVCPETVRRAIGRGQLWAHRIGDKGSELRIPGWSLRRYLSETLNGMKWLARSVGDGSNDGEQRP